VVAEGIEHPAQLAELREMGCGYGQGFLLARPMPVPGVEALIRAGTGQGAGAAVSDAGADPASSPGVSGTAKPGVPAA